MYIHRALHSVPLEEEMATHFSILTWEIPGTGAWWPIAHRVAKNWI